MAPDGEPVPYYVENFERILDTVLDRYADLLTAEERSFAGDLRALGIQARSLYVRLVSRVGPLFRRADLRYDEIPELPAAVDELAASGFLDLEPGADPSELLPHLRRSEIAELCTAAGVAASRATKSRSIAALLDACHDSPSAPRDSLSTPRAPRSSPRLDADALCLVIRELVPMVAPLRQESVTLYRLLFFGNLRQSWTTLLLADLGVWRYEGYPLRRDQRLFPTRAAIDDALLIRRLADQVRLALGTGDARAAAAVAARIATRDPPWDPVARPRADAVLLEVARPLEREGALEEALELYAAASAPPARERRARLYERMGNERRAIALCREIGAEPRDESERLFAARFEQRLRRRLGQLPPARRRYRTTRRLALRPAAGRSVETLVLERLGDAGCPGFHAENWLWLALYGLAFWDIIFAPVPGAFQHAYQEGPLDLAEPSFRPHREESIAARLVELEGGAWPAARLLAVWETKCGVRNRLVPWHSSVPERLELALSRLRGPHLAAVLDRLSRDLRRYGHGLPDLFVAVPGEPGFELLEVKSPGDRLRPEQIGWLDYLGESGLPSAVLAVEWSGSSGAGGAEVESPR